MALTGDKTFKIEFDASAFDTLLDGLGDDAAAAIRPAAQAAAQVIYEQVQRNVLSLGRKTGNLYSSIYQAHSPENSVAGQREQYNVSWNHSTAPHGHLVEYGYLQRYRYYHNSQGEYHPMIRPGMDGRPRPGRHASQEVKDAYYVPLPTPKQIPGKAFVRSAASAIPRAQAAAEAEIVRRLLKKGADLDY